MIDGDEFCVRLGGSVGRLNVDTFGGLMFATSSSLRTEVFETSCKNEVMYAGGRLYHKSNRVRK